MLSIVRLAAIARARATMRWAAMPVIFLSSRSPEDSVYVLDAFRQGLRETGFVDGHNISIEFRWARGQYDRLSALAADLADRKVAAIAALLLFLIAMAAILAPVVAPYDPYYTDLTKVMRPPDGVNLMALPTRLRSTCVRRCSSPRP